MTAAAASTHARTVVDSTLPTQMQICEVKDFTIRVHVILFELSLGSGSGRRHWPIWIAGQERSIWRTLRPSAGQAQQ